MKKFNLFLLLFVVVLLGIFTGFIKVEFNTTNFGVHLWSQL